jgi:molybdopterin synthase sulfur carrier subunit
MGVTVRIPTPLRKYTGDQANVEVSGSTIGEVIDNLETSHSGIKENIVDETGGVRRFVNIYVNEEDIRFLDGPNTPLKSGDSVTIVPAIAGGGPSRMG